MRSTPFSVLCPDPRAAKPRVFDETFVLVDGDALSRLERLVEHDRQASEEIRNGILSGHGDGQTADPQRRDQRADLDPGQVLDGHDADDDDGENPKDLADQRHQHVVDAVLALVGPAPQLHVHHVG